MVQAPIFFWVAGLILDTRKTLFIKTETKNVVDPGPAL
jgi:hypothetical protein